MRAVFKREFRSYFSSPVGYVCVAALVALFGFYYFQVMLSGSTSFVTNVFSAMFTFCMMIIPIITMRSLSEDRKNKTDQALLTAPVSVTGIVLGKFFASFCVYFIAMIIGALLPAFAMNFFSSPPWALIIGNLIGTLLYGAAMISIGIFISSLTESQVIAAIGTFIVSVILMYIDGMASSLNEGVVRKVIEWISFYNRYSSFTAGIFSVSAAVFFLSIVAIFVFLTSRRVESRRWR